MAEKPPIRVMMVLAVLSTRLCALADAHVPKVAEPVLAIPRLPGKPRALDDTDRTTPLPVVALPALALCAGSNRDTDDIDTHRPERIA